MTPAMFRLILGFVFSLFCTFAFADDKGGTGGGGGGAGSGGAGGGQSDGGGGQGGGGSGGGGSGGAPTHITMTRKEYDDLMAAQRGGGSGGSGGGSGGDDDPLRRKVKEQQEQRDKEQADHRMMEDAIAFNYSLVEFGKRNAELLPKETPELIAAAGKENYDSQVDKANAIKRSIIESYFAVQDNLDQLLPAQRAALDEFQKLSKTGKEQRAAAVYANIFEPTLEMQRKLKRAEELALGRGGQQSTGAAADYRNRMIAASHEHYGVKAKKA